jgi:hypothetical protein
MEYPRAPGQHVAEDLLVLEVVDENGRSVSLESPATSCSSP